MTIETVEPPTTFDIQHTPTGHFQLYLAQLIARLVNNITQTLPPETLESLQAEYPFIETYRQTWAEAPFAQWLSEFEATYEEHLPLRAVRQALELTDIEIDLLLIAGLIEEDIRFGALFAALQHPLTTRYPCFGILAWLLARDSGQNLQIWQMAERLANFTLIEIKKGEGTVRLEWTVQIRLPIWDAFTSDYLSQNPTTTISKQIQYQSADLFPSLANLILADALRKQITNLPEMIEQGYVETLVLRGMTGTGRRSILGALARHLGRDIILYDSAKPDEAEQRLLGVLATLTGALPVMRLTTSPGETMTINRLPGYTGTLGIAMGRAGGLEGTALENALTLTVAPPDIQQRTTFWDATKLPLNQINKTAVTERLLLSGGRINQVGQLARNQMHLEGRSEATIADIRNAMRAVNRQALETLATPLTAVDGWSQLVVPAQVEAELHILEARCQGREKLLGQVGLAFKHNLNRGVRAMFSGVSGTGKTLAARALAGILQMDIYRVDLASVVNKYIGETEKNLNRVFNQAEELDVILLLDEGDSLMTQRTNVQGANDRYANLETNFLLQRLENYEGIILITTNASQRIDQAFVRRLDVVIDFVLPEADERQRLWELHLPGTHQINPAFLARVSERCKLTGGQIRNAALHASLRTLPEQTAIIDIDLDAALEREYRKAGVPYPLAVNGRKR